MNPDCYRGASDLTQVGGPGQRGKVLVRGTSEEEAAELPESLKVADENSQG